MLNYWSDFSDVRAEQGPNFQRTTAYNLHLDPPYFYLESLQRACRLSVDYPKPYEVLDTAVNPSKVSRFF